MKIIPKEKPSQKNSIMLKMYGKQTTIRKKITFLVSHSVVESLVRLTRRNPRLLKRRSLKKGENPTENQEGVRLSNGSQISKINL